MRPARDELCGGGGGPGMRRRHGALAAPQGAIPARRAPARRGGKGRRRRFKNRRLTKELRRMKCNELESLVNDIARKRRIDAAVRESAYAHARDCGRCASRLTEEKQLTVGLRALAILDENKQASANVEANLLSAFRKQAEVSRKARAIAFSPAPKTGWRVNRWAVAAAVILLMLALADWRIQTVNKGVKAPDNQANQHQPEQQ